MANIHLVPAKRLHWNLEVIEIMVGNRVLGTICATEKGVRIVSQVFEGRPEDDVKTKELPYPTSGIEIEIILLRS